MHPRDTDIDGLFRRALQPLQSAPLPLGSWGLIVARVRILRPSTWSRIAAWMQGFTTPPSISSHQALCMSPSGQCWPAPIASAMAVQLLDARVAA